MKISDPPQAPAAEVDADTAARSALFLQAIFEAQLLLLRHAATPEILLQVLRCIGEAAGACRAYYFVNDTGEDGRLLMTQKAEWCAPGVTATLDSGAFSGLAYDDFLPEWQKHVQPDTTFGAALEDFSPGAQPMLAAFGVRLLLMFPLMVLETFHGFIGFVSTRETRPWNSAESDLLKGAATGIAFALERQETERALARERDLLFTVMRANHDALIAVDANEHIILANDAAGQLFNLPTHALAGCELSAFYRVSEEGTGVPRPSIAEEALARRSLVERPRPAVLNSTKSPRALIVESAAPIALHADSPAEGVLLVIRDVTTHTATERENQTAAKLESIGLLAGGIAHDFNNVLMAILGNLSLARQVSFTDADRLKWLEKAEKSVQRGRILTSKLLTFSAGGTPTLNASNIAVILEDAVQQAREQIPGSARFHYSPALPEVMADAKLLAQAFAQLILNAYASQQIAEVDIRVEHQVLDDEVGQLLITFEDHGEGIPVEIRHRILDPFFSTRPGHGGLGLAIAHSIIKRHCGSMAIHSEKGQGTRVVVTLSAAAGPLVAGAEKLALRTAKYGVILEDDETLRDVLAMMLRSLKLEVKEAASGEVMLDLCAAAELAGKPFDVAVMDLTIHGGMGGKEAVLHALKSHPDLRCIAASGYSNDPVMARFRDFGFSAALQKPFNLSGLREAFASAGLTTPQNAQD